jgi:putative MATE family efflux protein
VAVQRRAGLERPDLARIRPLLRMGGEIAVRTSALLGSFLVASAVLARIGAASLAAHQIAFQLYVFLALVLDALAIAAQVIVGRGLGAGDARGAQAAAARVILWSVVVGAVFGVALAALSDVIPGLFTDDAAVRARAHDVWWIFVAMMPANGAVFALDGILIGAGDTRYLMWAMLASAAVYVPLALLALHEGWGITGVWCGLAAQVGMRLATCGGRFINGRWALTGAPA